MKKLTKEQKKQLSEIAKLLPKQYYEVSATHQVILTGEDIINQGIKTAVKIDADKLYSKNKTVKTAKRVNHFLRLKRLFLKHGELGVKEYVTQCINFKNKVNESPNNILKLLN